MKVILTIMILLEAVLLFYAVGVSLPRSASYKTTVTRVSADGSTEMVSESQWVQVSPQLMAESRRRHLKPSIAIFILLALNTGGIVYVLRRLKRTG
jgi:hypothetical protein